MTPTDDQIADVAGRLTKGAAKACVRMTDAPQWPGRKTFDANGAWALHWARGCGGRGALCVMTNLPDGAFKRTAYSLTALGLAVRAHLIAQGEGQSHG
jgi:hypothetical protein